MKDKIIEILRANTRPIENMPPLAWQKHMEAIATRIDFLYSEISEEEIMEEVCDWCSKDENVPHLPQNAGELIAVLTKWALSKQAKPISEEAQDMINHAKHRYESNGLNYEACRVCGYNLKHSIHQRT